MIPANDYGDFDSEDNWDGDVYCPSWERPSLPFYKRLRVGKVDVVRETEKAFLLRKQSGNLGFWIPKKLLKCDGGGVYVWVGFEIKWIHVSA